MPLFPDQPYLGQLFITDGKLWRWNGLTWGAISFSLSNSPTPPSEPAELTLEALEARITAIEEALNQSFLLID